MNTITTKNASTPFASHLVRPRLASWDTFVYTAAAGTTAAVACIGVVGGASGVEAGMRGTDLRDLTAQQGAPPRRIHR